MDTKAKCTEDLYDVIEEVLENYGDCSKEMVSAILYKKIVAHITDIGTFIKEMSIATRDI